jgi:UDP-N-acetylmuramate dehydrogenase
VTMHKPFDLKPYNTFGFAATATAGMIIESVEQLIGAIKTGRTHDLPLVILGGGSNVVIHNIMNAMVLINRIPGIELVREDFEHVYIRVGAGLEWDQVVQYSLAHHWYGLENLSIIPGTAGACPIQNVGAYGVEIKDFFHELEAVDLHTSEIRTFSHSDCKFGYRDSIFKNACKDKFAIVSITLKLNKTPKLNISYSSLRQALHPVETASLTPLDVRKAVIEIRTKRLPSVTQIGNVGSFFTNPTIDAAVYHELTEQYDDLTGNAVNNNQYKLSAGWLIAKCGWQAYREDNIGVYPHNPLVLVNHGAGTSMELLTLAHKITASVREKFAIQLEMEPRIY